MELAKRILLLGQKAGAFAYDYSTEIIPPST